MKILFVHDHVMRKYNNDFFSTGGLSNEVFQRYLEKDDEIYVYTRVKNITDKENKLIQVNGNNVICKPSNIYHKPIDYYIKKRKLRQEVNARLTNIDFCIIRLQSMLGSIVLEEVKKKNIPYIIKMVACPWDSLWNYGGIKAKLFAPIIYMKTKKQVKDAKNVIYVSEKFLQERYPTKGNQISCSNVNIQKVKDEVLNNRIQKIEHMKNQSKFRIGLVGSLNVNFKGHSTAIKALSLLKQKYDVELHFLGAGDKNKWIPFIKKCNVEENVFFDGVLPSGEPVYKWMDELDIFLIPSLQEGLPRALIEAMSRGCPAIGVKTGGIPELLDERYVCKRKDYKSIAKKISELLEDKDIMIDQAEKNFHKAQNYTKDILNERRKNFFKQIYRKIKN